MALITLTVYFKYFKYEQFYKAFKYAFDDLNGPVIILKFYNLKRVAFRNFIVQFNYCVDLKILVISHLYSGSTVTLPFVVYVT